MNLEVTLISYVVPLTRHQWDHLERRDFLDVVCPKMEAIGIVGNSIEYNGHFGMNIYFSAPPTVSKEAILKILREVCS